MYRELSKMKYGIKQVVLLIYDILILPFFWLGYNIMELVDTIKHFFHYTLHWYTRQKLVNKNLIQSVTILTQINERHQGEVKRLRDLILGLGYVVEVIGNNVGFTSEEDEDIDYVRTLLYRL